MNGELMRTKNLGDYKGFNFPKNQDDQNLASNLPKIRNESVNHNKSQ